MCGQSRLSKTIAHRPQVPWKDALVGAAVRPEAPVEYEVVPLPGSSLFLGSSLRGTHGDRSGESGE